MNKTLPDKWIRKAIYDVFNGTTVDSQTINVYDSRYTADTANNPAYVILSVQSNEVDYNKCDKFWLSNILLEVCTLYGGTGNVGSRLLADNVLDSLRAALVPDLDLSAGGLEVMQQLHSFPSDLSTTLPNGQLFRKFLRLELKIK